MDGNTRGKNANQGGGKFLGRAATMCCDFEAGKQREKYLAAEGSQDARNVGRTSPELPGGSAAAPRGSQQLQSTQISATHFNHHYSHRSVATSATISSHRFSHPPLHPPLQPPSRPPSSALLASLPGSSRVKTETRHLIHDVVPRFVLQPRVPP